MEIIAAFGKMQSMDPAAPAVQAQVKKLQDFISEHTTPAPKPFWQPRQLYTAGGAFTQNINAAGGPGTAEFASKAIEVYCRTAK